MRDAHIGRGITQADFDKVAYHLTDALAAAGVPAQTIGQIAAAVTPPCGRDRLARTLLRPDGALPGE
jgi:hemoglobin